MVQIKSEKYTPLLKAYLTYTRTPELAGVLLKETKDTRYLVKLSGVTINEHRVTKPLWDAIKRRGGDVSYDKILKYEGRTKLFGYSVVIRPFTEPNKKTEHIRIRVTAEHAEELFDKLKHIKTELSKWGDIPKLCVWEKYTELQVTTEDKKPSKDSTAEDDVIKQERKKLMALIEGLQIDVAELKEQRIKKAIKEDREIMKGVLD